MKKKAALLILFEALHLLTYAQPAIDVSCQTNVFYGNVGNTIHALQLNSNSVTDLGTITATTTLSLSSLAMGNDITQGSTNRTFYSSVASGATPHAIVRYNSSAWTTITTDSTQYFNAAAYGPYIYFQNNSSGTLLHNMCIARLDASGNLTKIFTDTTLMFTLADMAIDTSGNIYCFRGTAIGSTTEITVLDPNGNIINSYATNLNNLGTLFGAMFLNGTLYIGHSTTNSSLFPVIFSGSTASLGSAIPMNISMGDLANCYSTVSNTVSLPEPANDEPEFTAAIQGNYLYVHSATGGTFTVMLYDLQGRFILEKMVRDGERIDVGHYANRIYLVKGVRDGRLIGGKRVVSSG